MEIYSIEEKRKKLIFSGKNAPTSQNYVDLLLNLTDEELYNYKLFCLEVGNRFCLGGFSEDGPAFNIYSNSKSACVQLFNYLKHLNGSRFPKYIRGNKLTRDLLMELFEVNLLNISRIKKFIPMWSKVDKKRHSLIEIRKAKKEDFLLVRSWVEGYNKELNENFSTPKEEEIESKNIQLAFMNGISIGGYFRTVNNTQRYWLARFFIFPKYRRQKLGRELLNAIHQQIPSNFKEIHLHVTDNNKIAQKFYIQCGFKTLEGGFNATIS